MGTVFLRVKNEQILGIVSVSKDEDVQLNLGIDETAYVIPSDHDVISHQNRWKINGGELVLKTEVTLQISKALIQANGVDECVVQFSGIVGQMNVQVLGTSNTITAADPNLVITSDLPQTFLIEIIDSGHWGIPAVVKAV